MAAESLGEMKPTKIITTGSGHGYQIGEEILVKGKLHRVEAVSSQMIKVTRFNWFDRIMWRLEVLWFAFKRKIGRA